MDRKREGEKCPLSFFALIVVMTFAGCNFQYTIDNPIDKTMVIIDPATPTPA